MDDIEKENSKKNNVIFSLLLSFKINEENKRKRKEKSYYAYIYIIFDFQSYTYIFFIFLYSFLSVKSKYINKEIQVQRFQLIHRKYTKRNLKS